ncbi:adenylate/guanylate cyclase domain-containing protein [Microvirga tunisiensis]|uniref:Adenylate/guanylate cyclase domain-containing protein n=2 Tax=Pannonibacter tanglangensis TaxID=2750084 RepID=A0A7X5F7Y0_9HYPH|nr:MULTISPECIES: adenylate/guanylate cyclase domain-containing protein [unclassified Pannonibacter]NBN66020.1 adenylate/guanylate cyclase domain-containing protein [Pannonibacter sp. XCT-34]NBN80515.1 adenylate/guanylate cyclase domain-containing protein [Pannonibacter sp. XCT-53]
MQTNEKIEGVEDWLISLALGTPTMATMFEGLCQRLCQMGIPVDRALLAWATLHPLIETESVFWRPETPVEHEKFRHEQEETEAWLKSPMRRVWRNGERQFRRQLDRSAPDSEFPLLAELKGQGFADYLVLSTPFELPSVEENHGNTGVLVSWATRRPGGFTDADISAIGYLQKRLALAVRANVQAQITRTVAETYLGRWAGTQVLNGQIRHGDGQSIEAVIFYCDMRESTAHAEKLGPDRYLRLLNRYFDATAGAVEAQGGEILDFIGDAVLGIFPIAAEGLQPAAARALAAARMSAARLRALDVADLLEGTAPLKAGIALSVGRVMFGNIGIANRLTFSVIGQTVHAAARMEALTKDLRQHVLLTEDIAGYAGRDAEPVGDFHLAGFRDPRPLFALRLA